MIRLSLDALPTLLKPGMTVFIPGATGEPSAALQAFEAQAQCARGIHFVANFIPGINEFDLLALDPGASLTTFFMQPSLSAYAGTPRLIYRPISYFSIDQYLRELSIDLAIVQVSPPDDAGQCSLGPCIEFNPTVLKHASISVALVNERVPRLADSQLVSLESFTYAVVADAPLRKFGAQIADELSTRIADRVASLIDDHDTLQMGIGKIPSQVLAKLGSRRELRIHSGLATSEILPLIQSGVIREHSSVVCGCFDASEGFFAANPTLPWLTMKPTSYTHDPVTLAGINRFVSINSSIEVDLLGQCNAEIAGGKMVSGPGGLPDFTPAAHLSKGGRSIIALPSTDRSGRISRIIPKLNVGTPHTLAAGVVDFVVTEYGIASLRGKNDDQRARALIEIAHPNFREGLMVPP